MPRWKETYQIAVGILSPLSAMYLRCSPAAFAVPGQRRKQLLGCALEKEGCPGLEKCYRIGHRVSERIVHVVPLNERPGKTTQTGIPACSRNREVIVNSILPLCRIESK